MIRYIMAFLGWYAKEYMQDYRTSNSQLIETIRQTTTQINQIILAVSVACLTAVAALSQRMFELYGGLAFMTIASFVFVILLSVINLYLSSLTLRHAQDQLSNNLFRLKSTMDDMGDLPYEMTTKILGRYVLGLFCAGVVLFLTLLGLYILGVAK